MFHVRSNCSNLFASRLLQRFSRFPSCESGATTAEYAIIASFVVALGVAGVTTTRGGATVSTNNTVTAMEAQAPMFEKLADQQKDVQTAYEQYNGSGSGSGPTPKNNVTVMPAQSDGSDAEGAPADNSEQNADAESSDDQQNVDQGTETTQDQATEQTAETQTEDNQTETADAENTSSGSGTTPDGGDSGTEDPEDETEVVQNVKPGCENPYNKRGKIKRKCR